jgi:hypothetical protein
MELPVGEIGLADVADGLSIGRVPNLGPDAGCGELISKNTDRAQLRLKISRTVSASVRSISSFRLPSF